MSPPPCLTCRAAVRLAVAALLTSAAALSVAQESDESIPTPRWQFAAGQELPWQLTHRVQARQSLEADSEVAYDLTMTMKAHWRVGAIKDDGSAVIEQSIDQVAIAVQGPGEQTMAYDSQDADPPRGFAARIAPLVKVLQEEPLQAVVSPRGVVSDVVVPEALQQQLRIAPGAKNLGALASTESLKNLVEQSSFVLPEQPSLKVGDQWQQTAVVEAPLIGKMQANKTFRYTQQRTQNDRTLAVFEPTIELTVPDAGDGERLAVELADQRSSGEILFDGAAGRLHAATLKQATRVTFHVGDRTSTQQIDQTIETRWGDDAAQAPEE